MENQRRKPTDSNPITEFYFDQILVETRYIDAVVPDTSVELFGRKFSTPVMTAALSHIKGKDGDGMVQMAQGASEAGALTWVGMTSLEQYGEIAKNRRAPGANHQALRGQRGDILPHRAGGEAGSRCRWAWTSITALTGRASRTICWETPCVPQTLEEIASYCKRTKLPFLIKGVLSAQDAQKCLDAGVGGILVSHHHGIMASAVPALMVPPGNCENRQGKNSRLCGRLL